MPNTTHICQHALLCFPVTWFMFLQICFLQVPNTRKVTFSFFPRQYNLKTQYTYKYSKEEADAVIKAGDLETGTYGKNVSFVSFFFIQKKAGATIKCVANVLLMCC